MTVGSLVLTILPIVLILCLLIVFKKPADISGIVGWLAVSVIAFLFFKTSAEVIFRSTIAGLIKSFAVSLVVATSLLQMAFLEKTGALKRIIIFMKTIASENRAVQIMIINIGFGTLMVAVGATPVSLLPPILVAMGYSTYVAIALPAVGYDSLCTYALLGAPIVAFVDIANGFLKSTGSTDVITLSEAGRVFYMFLPIVSTMIGMSMLWITGRWKAVKEGWLPCVITGGVIAVVAYFTNRYENLVVLTGILCGIAVILVMALYLKLTGKKVIDRSKLTKEEIEYEKSYPLIKALTPWILLILSILVINLPEKIFELFYKEITLPINGIAADGQPIATRAIWNAYTWILISTLLSIPFLRPTTKQLKETIKVWWKRAPRPVFAAAIFFAIGEVMSMSGYNMAEKSFEAGKNMVRVLAEFSANCFDKAYGVIVSFIGLFGGFITGSEASTIGMFGKYTMATAQNLNMGKEGLLILAAGLAFGGGLASVISPAKLQNAAASIDKLGEENKVIRTAFVFSLIFTTVTSGFVMLFLKTGIL